MSPAHEPGYTLRPAQLQSHALHPQGASCQEAGSQQGGGTLAERCSTGSCQAQPRAKAVVDVVNEEEEEVLSPAIVPKVGIN